MAYTRYRLPVLFPLSSLVLSLSPSLPFFSLPPIIPFSASWVVDCSAILHIGCCRLLFERRHRKARFSRLSMMDNRSVAAKPSMWRTVKLPFINTRYSFRSSRYTRNEDSLLFFFFEHRLFQNYPNFLRNSQISIFQKNFSRWSGDRNNSKCNNSIMYIPFSRGGGRNR